MSWSFGVIGTPAAIVAELDRIETTLNGQSLEEFKEAKPGLAALVRLNVGGNALQVEASGHASFKDGTKTYANCNVHIRPLSGKLLSEPPPAAAS